MQVHELYSLESSWERFIFTTISTSNMLGNLVSHSMQNYNKQIRRENTLRILNRTSQFDKREELRGNKEQQTSNRTTQHHLV